MRYVTKSTGRSNEEGTGYEWDVIDRHTGRAVGDYPAQSRGEARSIARMLNRVDYERATGAASAQAMQEAADAERRAAAQASALLNPTTKEN